MTRLRGVYRSFLRRITRSLWGTDADGRATSTKHPQKPRTTSIQSRALYLIALGRMSSTPPHSSWWSRLRWSRSWWRDKMWRIRSRLEFLGWELATQSQVARRRSLSLKIENLPGYIKSLATRMITRRHSIRTRVLTSRCLICLSRMWARRNPSSKLIGTVSLVLEIWTRPFISSNWPALVSHSRQCLIRVSCIGFQICWE